VCSDSKGVWRLCPIIKAGAKEMPKDKKAQRKKKGMGERILIQGPDNKRAGKDKPPSRRARHKTPGP